MDRYDYEERQRRRNQGGSERFGSDRSNRFRDDDDRYNASDRDREGSDFDRYSRSRYGRDGGNDYNRFGRDGGDSHRYGQNQWGQSSDRFNSQYSSNDRSGSQDRHGSYDRSNTGGSDRWEYRPSEDYRSLRDDSRFDNSRWHSQAQRAYNEYDQSFDPNLGGRHSASGRKDWDYDRTSSYPGYSSSQGTGSHTNRYDSGQSFGTNYGSSGSQRQGYSGSFGQNSGYGSSGNYGQEYGYNSGSHNQGQSRWGSGSSFESKAGRGPKGYRRSDERVKEEISDLLTSHHEVDPSEVEIKVSNCEVTLTGTVNSREEKRLIEDLVSQIQGVNDVTNQLHVQPSHDSSRSSSSSEGTNKSGQSQGFSGQASSGQKDGSQQSSKSIQ